MNQENQTPFVDKTQITPRKQSPWKIAVFALIGIILIAGIVLAIWYFWSDADNGQIDPNKQKCLKQGAVVCKDASACNGSTIKIKLNKGVCCSGSCTGSGVQPSGDYEDSPFGAFIIGIDVPNYSSGKFDDALNMGVKWTMLQGQSIWKCIQVDVSKREYNFKGPCFSGKTVSALDEVKSNAPISINSFLMFEGWVIFDDPKNRRFKDNSWEPKDEYKEDYINYITKVVERYDGDEDLGCEVAAPDCYVIGDEQYPDEKTISYYRQNPQRYWKLTTEPSGATNPNWSLQGFAELLRLTYTGMKSADSQAKLANGAVPGPPYCYLGLCPNPDKVFGGGFSPLWDLMLGELRGKCASFCSRFQGPCNNNCIDIFFIHWYPSELRTYKIIDLYSNISVIPYIRQKLVDNGFTRDFPIWISNIDFYTGQDFDQTPPVYTYPNKSESFQSEEIVKQYVYALFEGVKKIIMEGVLEGKTVGLGPEEFIRCRDPWSHSGVIYDGGDPECGDPGLGIKKLGYWSYKLMVEKLEGSDWDNIQEVYNSRNVYAYKFINKQTQKQTYVVWWDYWNEPKLQTKQVTIHVSGISGSVKITESVPHFENGLLLQNSREVYPNFFDKGSASVTNNQITITLGKSPVYIEQTTENLGNYIPHIWNDSPSPSNYTCPNKQCETSLGENSKNCPADCGSSASYTCPNKVCESSLGENSKNCPADCTSVNK